MSASASTAPKVTRVVAKKICNRMPNTNISSKKLGGSSKARMWLIPVVAVVVFVAIRNTPAAASAIADGLKMCEERPSRRQRTNSREARAHPTSRSWPKKYSGSNHRKRLMLPTTGRGPKPARHFLPRDHCRSISSA